MNVFESIAAVQADVEFIGKDKKVTNGNYKYRGVDQVLNTLHPLFAKHKLFAVPEVLEVLFRELRQTKSGGEVVYQALKVRYTFYAEDGTSLSAIVVGEAMDSGDKVSNKCMSVAYKYACFQTLSIPTEETTQDPDEVKEELLPSKKAENPITPYELKQMGVSDVAATAKWIANKYGKRVSELTEDEAREVRQLLKKKQKTAQKRAEAFEEAEEPAPWDVEDD